ncbi:PTS system mannose/fructose/sorbose family transporter subunit IID [Enterococcus faecium]|uniref:PTS system mannose/fructose/sorbose family transporter subunit IID n=1 Tax=Enterococcus faecium TaxID=1352 RepID=UPI0039C630EC
MTTSKEITKKDLNRVFLRSFTINASFNYERQMNQGYAYSLIPIINKLYPNIKEKSAALERHSEFFNVTPMVAPFVMGITIAMEEENISNSAFDETSISAVKASLMGPLSGIGDSVFWGTLRPLAAGIACSLALAGNAFAPILFLLMFNIPNVLVRYYGLNFGYKMGMDFLTKFEKLGITQKIFQSSSILGLLVIGGMTAALVNVNLGISFGSGDGQILLMDVIDGIMPKMLPLLTTLGIYQLIRKGYKVNLILVGIIIFSILGTWIGIF